MSAVLMMMDHEVTVQLHNNGSFSELCSTPCISVSQSVAVKR